MDITINILFFQNRPFKILVELLDIDYRINTYAVRTSSYIIITLAVVRDSASVNFDKSDGSRGKM